MLRLNSGTVKRVHIFLVSEQGAPMLLYKVTNCIGVCWSDPAGGEAALL
jgi:hypothetical protein